MQRQPKMLWRGLCIAGFIGCLFAILPAVAETVLANWNDFDACVASEYENLSASAPCYPPAEFRFGISHPPVSFASAAFADLTNAVPPRMLAGVPAWTLRVSETQTTNRVWIVCADGLPVRTNAVPFYDPEAWSRAAYGDPPDWLNGGDLARWYRERARDRIELGLTLIPIERFDEYLANLHAAATNGPATPSGPAAPADTNRVAFARVAPSSGTLAFDIYTPGDLPVDIFSKTNLLGGPLWNYAGTVQAVAPLFDAAGNLVRLTDANGRETHFHYDARGLLTNSVNAAGHATATDYDGRGLPATVTDARANTTAFLWTPSGESAAVLLPDGATVTNVYDAVDRLAAITDPRGTRVDFERDAVGRVTRRHTASWQERTWYDIVGCATSVLDAASVWTDYGYDWLDRPGLATDGLGREWRTAFDALDRTIATTDPRGRTRQYAYDPLGRRTAAVRPSGATDSFAYDGFGNWTTYTNAEGHVYTMTYDAQSRPLAATNALGQQVFRNFYDPVGNLTNRLDGAGNATRYAYDELNRLVRRESGVWSPASSFSYDAVGNLLSASNAVAQETFAYDVMDRVASATTTINNHIFATQWKRDLGGLVTNLVYAPGKTASRTYDPDGRLVAVSDWLGHTWTFAWDGAGKLTGGTAPSGILSTNTYDAAGRLASWSVGTLAGRTITRDAAGLKTRDDITAGPLPAPHNVRYAENTFDAADRLVAASVRYGSHTNAAVAETYLYDDNGALTNLISGSNAVFSSAYDPLGQISSLRSSAFFAANYLYDALGNRIVTGDRLWIPDHADPLKRPLIEADAATGAPIRYYLWAPGRLLGFIDAASGALTVAHCDEYGSVVALTDASGTVLHTAVYGPNGQDWGTTGTNPTPFTWLGGHGVQKTANSNHLGPLYLTRYRLYSASLNRFVSPDPLGLAGGLNLYAYAEGDPLSYIDPLGLCGESVWGAAASGFLEGLGGGLSILANSFSFGGTDALGWTDSSSYEGSAYTASRVAATVARESLITATTLGLGTAARGGSAVAQTAYKGVLATQSATGGYQIGSGARQIAEGNYEAGAVNIVAGGLRVGGSIVGAGAIAQNQSNWTYGSHKSTQKFQSQMQKRGWTPQQIDEAMTSGNRITAPIQVNSGNTATRYIHPTTGRSVVVDDVTHEVLHVGGDGFRY